ncbi:hypothetical protein NONI108955_08815 [Nocardia ninae]|uniref:Uncharacterized protein n=1 Tax=Nocardia ninae NBRC 108245 TaxID=1210091 RepID=A0A511ML26_9NOCA|nr:hypothetical protein [Nocardia ninae]GEM40837.1 hypothetical protein NN4_53560 [Nocardia ninae NBRC 108245]
MDGGTIVIVATACAAAVPAVVAAVAKAAMFFRAMRDTPPDLEGRSKVIESFGKMCREMKTELPMRGVQNGIDRAEAEE